MTAIPTTEPTADPSVRLCVNYQWTPFVIGLLHPGIDPTWWRSVVNPETDPEDMETLAVGIERLIGEMVQDSGDCLPASPCNPEGSTYSDTTNFTSGSGTWHLSIGERTSNGWEVRNPTGSLWLAQGYLTLPGPICLDYIEVNYYWDAEFLVDPNPPHGNLMLVEAVRNADPLYPDMWLEHENTNSNLDPTLRWQFYVDGVLGGRFVSDEVRVRLEGGHNATQAMAWIKSITVHGRSP